MLTHQKNNDSSRWVCGELSDDVIRRFLLTFAKGRRQAPNCQASSRGWSHSDRWERCEDRSVLDVPRGFAHKKEACVIREGVDEAKSSDVSVCKELVGDLKVRTEEEKHTQRSDKSPSCFVLYIVGHRKRPCQRDHHEVYGCKDLEEQVFVGEEKIEVKPERNSVSEERGKKDGRELFFAKADVLGKIVAVEHVCDQEHGHPERKSDG